MCYGSRLSDLPMGPMGLAGLNSALKQRLVLKHECLRPLASHGLLKMLILSGLKEALGLTDATPLDLKPKHNSKSLMNFYHSYCIYPIFNHHSFHCFNTVMVKITKAAPLCHMHQWKCQGPYRHSDLCRYPETFQNARAEGPDSGWGFSETNKGYQCHNRRKQATKKWRTTKEAPLVYQISWPVLTCENCFLNVCFSPLYM